MRRKAGILGPFLSTEISDDGIGGDARDFTGTSAGGGPTSRGEEGIMKGWVLTLEGAVLSDGVMAIFSLWIVGRGVQFSGIQDYFDTNRRRCRSLLIS